jgi:hypothetical protein
MPSRPESSAVSAMANPRPSAPIRWPVGTRAPSKITWAVTEARMPILCSAGAALTPPVAAGTCRQLIPRARSRPAGVPEVRANTV